MSSAPFGPSGPAGPHGPGSLAGFAADRSSFYDLLGRISPELLPGAGAADSFGSSTPQSPASQSAGAHSSVAPHGTTIVAVAFEDGVLIAGDRRATMGNQIAMRDIDKVFPTDEHTAVGIAGTAGVAVEIVRLFAVELEHYEKLEGVALSFDGKANRLAAMVRGNLGAAMQGLAVIPLLVGFDLHSKLGRIVSFDVTGGRYEERAGYFAIGSGSVFAKSSLKKLFRPGLDRAGALAIAVEALFDAADDDSATGGPDPVRALYPTAIAVTADGVQSATEAEIAEHAARIAADRTAAHRSSSEREQ